MRGLNQKGQNLMELVVGIGLLVVVVGAVVITTTQSLQNTQFSKNQAEATKKAQENLEKVRTIRNSNFGVCKQSEVGGSCSAWSDIWLETFGQEPSCSVTNGCTFKLVDNCTMRVGSGTEVKPFCLQYNNPTPSNRQVLESSLAGGTVFTGEIVIEDEPGTTSQKRVTSRVYWNDASGEHYSDLVTVLSRL